MQVAHAQEREETLGEIVARVTKELDFDAQIVHNVIEDESKWDCTAVGESGELGCFQLMPQHWVEVDPLDFERSLRYFVEKYNEGYGYWWTACSCVKSIKTRGVVAPVGWSAWDFIPNTTPHVGAVAVYRYGSGEDGFTWHVAKVTALNESTFTEIGSNIEPCKRYEREVSYNDKNLVGFWKDPTSP